MGRVRWRRRHRDRGGGAWRRLERGASVGDLPRLATRLLEAARTLRIDLVGGARIGGTVSIGAAAMHDGEAIDARARRADAALYAAKGAGRDRIVVAD